MGERLVYPKFNHGPANVSYTIAIETEYGPMLVNRHDINQAQYLIQSGRVPDHKDIEELKKCIEPGTTVIDAGACFGAWTLAFARQAGKVFSFEGQRIVCQQLNGTLALNSIENVYVINTILDEKCSIVEVPVFDYNTPGQVGCVYFCERAKHGDDQPDKKLETEYRATSRLDDYKLLNVSLIKIDVEGMEISVLRGGIETIQNNRPILYVESQLVGIEKIQDFFKDLDYLIVDRITDVLCLPREKWNTENLDNVYKVARK